MVIAAKDVNPNVSPMRSTHSVVAIIDIGTAPKSLLVPIEITAERKVNGTQTDVNTISSVYEKSVGNLVTEAIALENSGDVGIFYAKKEALTLPAAGVQFPVRLQQSIASNGIVHHLSEKVNMKISEVTQSQQFKRWFGDWQNDPANASKVVNADGTPKVMYRGGNEEFTVFDRKKSKSSNLYGRGFYFTDSESHARQYGETRQYFLDIKNPLPTEQTTITKAQMRKFLQAVQANDEDFSFENYGYGATVNSVLKSLYGKSDFAMLYDVDQTAVGNMVDTIELFNHVNGTNFDGMILDTETVALYPNQIKSATDNIGTFDKSNPDIRFSKRTTAELLEYQKQLLEIQKNGNTQNLVDPKELRKMAKSILQAADSLQKKE